MKHLIKKMLILTALLSVNVSVYAYDFIVGGIKYNILTKSTCEVATGMNSIFTNDYKGKTFVIPPQVEYRGNQYTVTAISNYAFQKAEISEIIIPETITKIRLGAFEWSYLQRISIPSSLSEIPTDAFNRCKSLYYVKIPNGITEIGSSAFEECTLLPSIDIPNTVTEISGFAFSDCTTLSSVSIGNSIKYIYYCAFTGCHNITKITIHNPTPPKIICGDDSDVFQGITYLTATLYVPKGALDAYRNAPYWSKFESIKELENSGIENVSANPINVRVRNGGISVSGLDRKVTIEVYNTNGQLVYCGTETTISVPTKGIYIVRVAGQTFKVVI